MSTTTKLYLSPLQINFIRVAKLLHILLEQVEPQRLLSGGGEGSQVVGKGPTNEEVCAGHEEIPDGLVLALSNPYLRQSHLHLALEHFVL